MLVYNNLTCDGSPTEMSYTDGSETISRTLNLIDNAAFVDVSDSISVIARDVALNESGCVSTLPSTNTSSGAAITYVYSHKIPSASIATNDGASSSINVTVDNLLSLDTVNAYYDDVDCESNDGTAQTAENGNTATIPLELSVTPGTRSTYDIYIKATYRDGNNSGCISVGQYQFDDFNSRPWF